MPTTREIDRLAQNVFHDKLPPGWLIRKQDPDIHVDYFVEVVDRSEPSGVIFGVQLKGTGSPRYSKKLIKISIKTKHLTYYLDKVKQPIFLVVVDIKKKQGYWLFLQGWAKEELKTRNWREQETIVIKIPLTNSLSSTNKLLKEITIAEKYMHELWPSSIPVAIRHKKKSLEGLDHRIQVDISHHRGRTKYHLQAKETFNFEIHFEDSPHIQEKFSDLLDRGKTAIYDTSEIVRVSGSPLLESLFNKAKRGKLVIEPERKVQASLLLSTVDLKEKQKTILYGVDGLMWGGIQEARFEGGLKKTPFKLDFSLPIPISTRNKSLTIHFTFDRSEWQGVPVLSLPFFKQLKDLFVSIQEGCSLKIVCEIMGNHIFTVQSSTMIENNLIELTVRHLELLDKVRIIAKEVGINPKYPKNGDISMDEIKIIFLLDQLIQFGEYHQSGDGCTFRGELVPNDNFFKMLEEPTEKNFSGPLVIKPEDQKFCLFGEEFDFGLLRYTLTNPILGTSFIMV